MTSAIEIARRIRFRIRAAIAVRVWHAIHVAGKWRESSLVGMRLAGQGERHHGAAMKCVFKGDDAGTLRISASDFYCIFDRFCATVYKDRFLGELARSYFVHALGKT